MAYDFVDINAKAARYWRDVGTLDAYYEANMDLIAVSPEFNLYDTSGPSACARSRRRRRNSSSPWKASAWAWPSIPSFRRADRLGRPGHRSVLSPFVRVNSYSEVEDSILMPGVNVGRYSRVRRAILDEDVVLPENSRVGFDPDDDRKQGWLVTDTGITVVPSPRP